jgi:uncharacterized membrane protein
MTTLGASTESSLRESSNQRADHGLRQENKSRRQPYINVPPAERWTSGLSGAAMVTLGLKMRNIPGALMAIVGGAMVHRGWTGHCSGYAALGINRAQGEGAPAEDYFENGIHVSESVTIDKSPEELYKFWRNFENLPRFTQYLEDVKVIDDKRSHWKAKAPAGMSVEWDAEIINDEPNKTIAWRSLYPASVDNAGSVRFVEGPAGRGTEVRVVLDYIPPAGKAGWFIAKLFGRDPAAEVREDLRRFKQIMETGEVATAQGQPHGRRGIVGSMMASN